MNTLRKILFLLLLAAPLRAQNIPDRIIVLDPLGARRHDTAGFQLLTTASLYAEFGRYSNGSGTSHRWNARTGGVIELARWDSTASIAIAGTTEVIMDPLNDISFNPRAIFWEEGVFASFRLPADASLQAGYIHRCKHDIDNLFPPEQRTLIYSGVMTRALWRPRTLASGAWELRGGLALRNDFFLHLLDNRPFGDRSNNAESLERLINTTGLTARLDLRPADARYRIHLIGNFMISAVGTEPGFSERFGEVILLGAVPFIEMGVDLFNPVGASMTFFARGEWQRDAGIHATPERATLVLFGVRVGSYEVMW